MYPGLFTISSPDKDPDREGSDTDSIVVLAAAAEMDPKKDFDTSTAPGGLDTDLASEWGPMLDVSVGHGFASFSAEGLAPSWGGKLSCTGKVALAGKPLCTEIWDAILGSMLDCVDG